MNDLRINWERIRIQVSVRKKSVYVLKLYRKATFIFTSFISLRNSISYYMSPTKLLQKIAMLSDFVRTCERHSHTHMYIRRSLSVSESKKVTVEKRRKLYARTGKCSR